MSYSIQNINELPSEIELKKKSQALALLDAIIEPDWEYRYFSFNCDWNQHEKEMMASMRDGSGNEYFLLFSENGVAGKVFYGQNGTSLLLTSVPDCFSSFKNEAAFSIDNASFYFWRSHKDEKWSVSPNDLKTYDLLGFLANDSSYYHQWAESYYEKSINAEMLEIIFNTLYVDSDMLKKLNPKLTIEELREDILEIIGNDA